MKAIELVGKLAIRTNPVNYGNGVKDYSHTTDPIRILKVTENHIVYDYKNTGTIQEKIFENDNHILDNRWLDDNWTDYLELMKMDKNK